VVIVNVVVVYDETPWDVVLFLVVVVVVVVAVIQETDPTSEMSLANTTTTRTRSTTTTTIMGTEAIQVGRYEWCAVYDICLFV
jgi:hypothetical protein